MLKLKLFSSLLAPCALLMGCASGPVEDEVQLDPNHKQFVTGTRVPFKGRGGYDAINVKVTDKQSAKDALDRQPVPLPTSN